MDREKVIPFDPPLAFEGATVSAITLRVPRAGEVLAAEKVASETPGAAGPRAGDATLISVVAGISLGFVAEMPEAKRRAATAFLDSFSTTPEGGQEPNLAPDLQLPIEPAIVLHNSTYDLLDLRPPKSGEIDAAYRELGTAATAYSLRKFQIMLVARVSGYNRGVIERIPIDQLDEASRYLMGFT
jgi:hypothetical protein